MSREQEIESVDISSYLDPVNRNKYPWMIFGRWPIHILDRCRLRCWCELDEDFSAVPLSPISSLDHCVYNFISECSLDELLGCPPWGYEAIEWAIGQGLTYRQPFYVELMVRYYLNHTDCGEEWDCDTEFEILEVKSLPPGEVLKRYEEWIKR